MKCYPKLSDTLNCCLNMESCLWHFKGLKQIRYKNLISLRGECKGNTHNRGNNNNLKGCKG